MILLSLLVVPEYLSPFNSEIVEIFPREVDLCNQVLSIFTSLDLPIPVKEGSNGVYIKFGKEPKKS